MKTMLAPYSRSSPLGVIFLLAIALTPASSQGGSIPFRFKTGFEIVATPGPRAYPSGPLLIKGAVDTSALTVSWGVFGLDSTPRRHRGETDLPAPWEIRYDPPGFDPPTTEAFSPISKIDLLIQMVSSTASAPIDPLTLSTGFVPVVDVVIVGTFSLWDATRLVASVPVSQMLTLEVDWIFDDEPRPRFVTATSGCDSEAQLFCHTIATTLGARDLVGAGRISSGNFTFGGGVRLQVDPVALAEPHAAWLLWGAAGLMAALRVSRPSCR